MTTIRSNPSSQFVSNNPGFVDPRRFQVDDRAQFDQCCKTLASHFSEVAGFSFFGSGTIDMNELYAAAQGQKGGPEVQQAAQWLLAHPQYVTELETRGNPNPDGKISLGDLKTEITSLDREQQLKQLQFDPRFNEFQQSIQTIAQYLPQVDAAADLFGGPDGKISMKDLNAVMTNPAYPPELRRAAFFMSMNPDLMNMLDTAAKGGSPDGLVSTQDVQAMVGQLNNVRGSLPVWPELPQRGVYY